MDLAFYLLGWVFVALVVAIVGRVAVEKRTLLLNNEG